MFAGSRFCAKCGAEVTRDVVDDATPLTCPRCSESMQALRLGAISVHECAACGGLWVDPQTLQKLCDAREEHAGVVSALAARVPTGAAVPDTVRYIPCPQCRKLMNRVNFSKTSGVIMDVCKADGVWLDRGELERVVGFIEHGGLTIAREHEREQLADEQRRLTAREAGFASRSADVGMINIRSSTRGVSSSSPIDQLLRDALGLFVS
jgi:Zn-finger nucleic acid-binding protein